MTVLKALPLFLLSWSTILFGEILTLAFAAATASQESRRGTDGEPVGNASLLSSSFGQKGSKVCVDWINSPSDPSLANFKTSHVVGLYNWGLSKPTAADRLGFDYWPMLWGGQEDELATFEDAVTAGFGTIILGFNEPNEQGQSNLDPATAAALWRDYIEPKRSLGYKTCSPAVSARSNGLQWMQQFLQACSGCTIDFQCLHWYGVGFSNLEVYLNEHHDTFGFPILLTEFADQDPNDGTQPSLSDVITFAQQALEYFDDTDWILAACPYGFGLPVAGESVSTALQNADGTPTELGTIYINDEY
ncbi:Glycoside Hydrolase Family 128 protein [Trametes cinnabarina]|uniref:Glycoside Hydrolase Family 128 protein n=1 Tax=Pycnoporus cinnabarinus TaxID=5643 RepID=A0A060SNS0_PYCCI|nr:Glycoside Hydrolase Family 128 protein [Trametes cinnabarina]